MSISSVTLALVGFAVWVTLSYAAYRLALRLAPEFFAKHDPETALVLIVLVVACVVAVLI